MNTLFNIVAIAVIFAAIPLLAFDREYIEEAQLSPDEEKQIIKIAELYGITDITRIKTDFPYPGPEGYIRVFEAECIRGDVVSYRILSIAYEEWISKDEYPEFYEFFTRYRRFWVMSVDSVHQNIIRVDGEEFRVGLHGWDAKTCEEILEILRGGNYSVMESVNLDDLQRVLFGSPFYFLRQNETDSMIVVLGDKRDKLVTHYLTIKRVGDGVKIVNMDMDII